MDIVEPVPGLYRIRIPIPSPLAHVNCYLARGRAGWTIVDTGFHTAEGEAAWTEAFRRLGIAWGDIEKVVVTHYHPDHYGAAGWLQQRTGAPVLMHWPEAATARYVWSSDFDHDMDSFFRDHGVPDEIMTALSAMRAEARHRAQPAPQITPFQEGDTIGVGDRSFEALFMPGHTKGLIVLWDPVDRILLADDMVLTPISPNISASPAASADPLGDYLASLDRVAALPARLTFTGHRDLITDLATRCAEIKAHHRSRLAETLALVDGDCTAWEVAHGLFARQIDSPATLLFALGETVAHLEYLRSLGRIVCSRSEDGRQRYAGR